MTTDRVPSSAADPIAGPPPARPPGLPPITPDRPVAAYRRSAQVETGFDGTIRGDTLWSVLLRSVLGFALIYAAFLVASFVNSSSSGFGFGLPRPDASLRGAGLWVGLLYALVCWFVPRHEPLSEFAELRDGQGPIAESTFAALLIALRTRRLPAKVTPRQVRSDTGDLRGYVRLEQGRDVVDISVFRYGTGMYVGWRMSRHQLPVVMLGTWVAQRVAAATFAGTDFRAMLAADQSRALREAVHLAVIEGVALAARGNRVDLSAAGFDVPVGFDDQTGTRPDEMSSSTARPTPRAPLAPPPPTVPPQAIPGSDPGNSHAHDRPLEES